MWRFSPRVVPCGRVQISFPHGITTDSYLCVKVALSHGWQGIVLAGKYTRYLSEKMEFYRASAMFGFFGGFFYYSFTLHRLENRTKPIPTPYDC